MAVTISLYNHSASKLLSGAWNSTDTYKVMLLDATGTFTASHTVVGDVSSDQVSGNGWTVGGETLAGVSVSTVTTNDAKFDANDISVTASGGAIGPAENAVIINTTDTSALVAHIAFGEAKTADSGTDFQITWDASGIITATVA
jgi:hypothetical protein